jgi:hypothetical protein
MGRHDHEVQCAERLDRNSLLAWVEPAVRGILPDAIHSLQDSPSTGETAAGQRVQVHLVPRLRWNDLRGPKTETPDFEILELHTFLAINRQ